MRLLICTLYFPPCAFTPANRANSWIKYLNKFGVYPVIITRQWPKEVSEKFYFERSFGETVHREKYEEYEVHYVPFKGNLRTRLFVRQKKGLFTLIRQLYTVVELLLRYRSSKFLPYSDLYDYAEKYISNNKIDKILISGSPFLLFRLGYTATKKYSIPWIADYRDGWTVQNYPEEVGKLTNFVHKLNKYYEKKWLSNAESFITVSTFLKNEIEKYIGIKGNVIYNGFYKDFDTIPAALPDKKKIIFLYSGVVYPKQDYKTIVQVLKKIIDKYTDQINIQVLFLGTKYENPDFANDNIFTGYEDSIILMDRVKYTEALKIHAIADIFIMLSHEGMKGITSSKIFDYIKYIKPVILYKNDYDVLEEILSASRTGIIADNATELEKEIEKLVLQKMEAGFIGINADEKYIDSFSRENQAKKLALIVKNSNT